MMGDLTAVTVPDLQLGLKGALDSGVRELVFDYRILSCWIPAA